MTNYYNDHQCTVLIRHCNCSVVLTLGVWPFIVRHGRHYCYVVHVFPTILHTALLESTPKVTQQHENRSRAVSIKQRMCYPNPLTGLDRP